MPITNLPQTVQSNYEIYEWRHASTILEHEFPQQYQDMVDLLDNFVLRRSHILAAGGGRSPVAQSLDEFLYQRGWIEKHFNTSIVVDGTTTETATHKVDCYLDRVALDIEWNNKTEFYDRDLNNYRLLFERNAISVAIIITRSTELNGVLRSLGKYASYGASTTHMDKLVPRIHGGSGGGCPIIIFGITSAIYDPTT